MSLTLQTKYGEYVVAKLRQRLVTRSLFNTNYQRNAATGVLMAPVTPEVVIGDYNKGNLANNTVSYDNNAWIPMIVTKDKFIKVYIDGYNAAALPYNVLADNLDRVGYGLAKVIDTDAVDTLAKGAQGLDRSGNAFGSTDPRYQKTGTSVSIGANDVYDELAALGGVLTDKGVPFDGRWLLINGVFHGKILASNKAIRQSDLSQELILKGAIAQIAGFEVYVTGQVTGNIGTGESAKALYGIAGHPDFCTRFESFAKEPEVVTADYSSNAVGGVFIQGRYVFHHECLNPEAFGLITA